MSESPTHSSPPAGWYPDPIGESGQRWWDGGAWTERIRQAPPVAASVDAPPTEPPPSGSPPPPPPQPADRSHPPISHPGAASASQPGWYPDPAGSPGYRWWDGSSWTAVVTDPGAGAAAGWAGPSAPAAGTIGDTDRLLSETFRVTGQRFGHLLPYIVLFILTMGLVGAVAGWYGLRGTVITLDETTAAADIDYGGSPVALAIYLATFPLSMVAAVAAKAATARQAWTAQSGSPEPWSTSLAAVGRRWRSLLVAAIGRTVAYWLLGLGFVVGSVLFPPVLLTFPAVALAFVFLWLRLSFLSQVAVLAPVGSGPFSTSFRVTGRQPGRLLLRLVVLALVGAAAVVVVSLVGSVVTALAGIDTAVEVDPDGLVYDLDAYLGDSLAVFAIGSVFGALGLGLGYALSAVGTTLLYRNLDGPIDPLLLVADAPADAVAGETIESSSPAPPGP